jgi:hypothetical protein
VRQYRGSSLLHLLLLQPQDVWKLSRDGDSGELFNIPPPGFSTCNNIISSGNKNNHKKCGRHGHHSGSIVGHGLTVVSNVGDTDVTVKKPNTSEIGTSYDNMNMNLPSKKFILAPESKRQLLPRPPIG